jgi:hypothetical protein
MALGKKIPILPLDKANEMPFPRAEMNIRAASCFLPPLWPQRMILSEHHFVPIKRERINKPI